MRLSTVFELLLIFLFLALASSRHIEKKHLKKGITKQSLNSYCKCSDLQCNCCRDFPVVPIKGPGCAALGYQTGDVLRLTMSFGDRVLRNITLVGKRPKPVCMGLPGGVSKFCGRLYNIERLDDHFKACLALELRALDELEAALRVSCFNFGPKGVKLEPGEPIPSSSRPADDYDDDDDYDIDDDDDDDDDDEFDDDDDEYNDVESDGDYTGFAALSDQIFEGFFFPASESSGNKKKKPARPILQDAVVEVTTQALKTNLTDSVSTSISPLNNIVSGLSSTTEGPAPITSVVPKVTSSSTVSILSEKVPEKVLSVSSIAVTAATTELPSAESVVTIEYERENETEDSDSEEEEKEPEKDDKEAAETAETAVLDEEESGEGSAEEQLDENDKEEIEVSQAKLEDGNDDVDDDDSEEEEDDEEEDQDSDELNESAEEKDNDNILNVFFNRDDDSNETDRERRRMDREHIKKILPGLYELLKPSPTPPTEALYAFPSVRSARVHRRMRLPPI